MPRGRKRKFDPTIPAHVDQSKIPKGIFWDRSGSGRWYTFEHSSEGRTSRRTVADCTARLSDLHEISEQQKGVEKGTLGWLLDLFQTSTTFKNLAKGTQADYNYYCNFAKQYPTKLGRPLGQLTVARMSSPLIQRLIDSISSSGTPTKANHLLRYLRRVMHWGVNRGHCPHNPAQGVEQAKERKRRRLPTDDTYNKVLALAKIGANLSPHAQGSCSPYLWITMEIGYSCRLRPIEVITLTDADVSDSGILAKRRKGSRDTLVRWTPRLRAAHAAAIELRSRCIARHARPVALEPSERPLFVNESGTPLKKSSLDTAWQRLMRAAVKSGEITAAQRFGLHDLKRKGISDTPGNIHDKQTASGHRSESMMTIYDHSVATVDPASKA